VTLGGASGGREIITGCPRELVRAIWPVVDAALLLKRGLPPVAGGSLDQSASFLTAANFLLARLDAGDPES
jgi:hypothetical protein